MRKIIVLVLVLILAGGYTFYWHKKADEFKVMLDQSITALNEQAKPLTKGAPLIRYESLAATGFPFSMTIEVGKPVVDLPMATLLRAAPQPGLPAANPASTDWVEEISYGESVAFSGNITGNRFTLTASGDRTHKTLVNGQQTRSMVGSSSSPLVCHLKVEQDGGAPWTMRPVFTDIPTFIAIFRAGDCKVDGVTLKDAKAGTLLFSADAISASASNDAAAGADRKLVFTSEYKNGKATPALDAAVNEYSQLANLVLYQSNQPVTMFPLSAYGVMNDKIDVRYEGPTDEKGMADPQAKMHLDVNALNTTDDLAHSTIEAHISTVPEGTDRSASVKVKWRAEVSELFDKLMPQQFTIALTQMEQNGRTPQERAMGANLATLGKPEDVVAAVMPKLHPLGKMAFDVDASVKGPNGKPNEFVTKGVFKLDAFNWTAEPYGIKQNGNANLSLAGKPPTGELVINCINCDALVGDIGNYAVRLETLAGRIQQPPKPPGFGPDLIEGVKQFLHSIAENNTDKNAKDITIHIVMKDTGELLVSGKQIMEVAGLFGTTIAPHLNILSPAAGGMPAPVAPPHPAIH